MFTGSITLIVLVVAAAVYFVPKIWEKPSEQCVPVRALLNFNRQENARLAEKAEVTPADYRIWADGLAEKSADITDPELVAHAVRLVALAGRFVTAYAKLGPDPAAADQKPPKAAFEMSALNDQIGAELQQLEQLCPTD